MTSSVDSNKQFPFYPLHIILFTLLGIMFFYSLFRRIDGDEFEAIHTAWKILQKQRIYVDFFQHHNPLFYYFLAPIIYIFGETYLSLIMIRLFIFILFLAIGWTTYQIGKKVYNQQAALTGLILLLATPRFSIHAIEARPDVPQVLCCLLALLFLIQYLQKQNYLSLCLSALFLGISFLLLQKAIFSIIPLGLILLYELFRKQITLMKFIFYWLATASPLGIYLLYHLYQGSFSTYILCTFVYNKSYGAVGSSDYFHILPETFGYLLKTSPFVCLFAILGLIFFTKTKLQKFIAWLVGGLLFSIFLVPYPLPQYLLPALPFVALLAGNSLVKIFALRPKLFVSLIFIFASIPASFHFIRRPFLSPNTQQWEKIRPIMSVTQNGDYVMAIDRWFENNTTCYKLNLFRQDTHYLWMGTFSREIAHYKKITHTQYNMNILQDITTYKPKIISKHYLKNLNQENIPLDQILLNPVIHDNYAQSDIDDDLLIRIH